MATKKSGEGRERLRQAVAASRADRMAYEAERRAETQERPALRLLQGGLSENKQATAKAES